MPVESEHLVRVVHDLLSYVSSESATYKCTRSDNTVWSCDKFSDKSSPPSKWKETVLVKDDKVHNLEEYGKDIIKRALDSHHKLNSNQAIDNQWVEAVNVYKERFKTLNSEYTRACNKIILEWRSEYGEIYGDDNLRALLSEVDANQTQEQKHTKASEHRSLLHECGHTVDIGSHLLFRGTAKEVQPVEEFTATSLSFSSAFKYGTPIMIIYIPTKQVHGLVIKDYEKQGGQGTDHDSEILLLNPKMRKCSDKVRDEIVDHMLEKNMFENGAFNPKTKDLNDIRLKFTVWIYHGT